MNLKQLAAKLRHTADVLDDLGQLLTTTAVLKAAVNENRATAHEIRSVFHKKRAQPKKHKKRTWTPEQRATQSRLLKKRWREAKLAEAAK